MKLTDIIDENGRYCGFFADNKDPIGYVAETRHYSYLFTRQFYRYSGDKLGFDFLCFDMFNEYLRIEEVIGIYSVCVEFNRVFGDNND